MILLTIHKTQWSIFGGVHHSSLCAICSQQVGCHGSPSFSILCHSDTVIIWYFCPFLDFICPHCSRSSPSSSTIYPSFHQQSLLDSNTPKNRDSELYLRVLLSSNTLRLCCFCLLFVGVFQDNFVGHWNRINSSIDRYLCTFCSSIDRYLCTFCFH